MMNTRFPGILHVIPAKPHESSIRSLGHCSSSVGACASTAAKLISDALAVGRLYCGKSLQSLNTIMTVEPTATAAGQINGNSSRRPTMAARPRRVLFNCAKAQACHTHRTSPFGPQQQRPDIRRQMRPGYCQLGCSLNHGEGTLSRRTRVPGGMICSDCWRRDRPRRFDWTPRIRWVLHAIRSYRIGRNTAACGTGCCWDWKAIA